MSVHLLRAGVASGLEEAVAVVVSRVPTERGPWLDRPRL